MISTSFALACFAATLCYGIYNGNTWPSILTGALLAMLIAWIVGALLGSIALRSVNEHIKSYQNQHPIPDENATDNQQPADAAQGQAAGGQAVGT